MLNLYLISSEGFRLGIGLWNLGQGVLNLRFDALYLGLSEECAM